MIIENKIDDIIVYKIRMNKNFVPRSANKLLPPFFIVLYLLEPPGQVKHLSFLNY